MKPHAVYAYGVVSSSTLYSIGGTFPSPEGYAEIDDRRHIQYSGRNNRLQVRRPATQAFVSSRGRGIIYQRKLSGS